MTYCLLSQKSAKIFAAYIIFIFQVKVVHGYEVHGIFLDFKLQL